MLAKLISCLFDLVVHFFPSTSQRCSIWDHCKGRNQVRGQRDPLFPLRQAHTQHDRLSRVNERGVSSNQDKIITFACLQVIEVEVVEVETCLLSVQVCIFWYCLFVLHLYFYFHDSLAVTALELTILLFFFTFISCNGHWFGQGKARDNSWDTGNWGICVYL